jgi:hypothetical protein
MGSSREIARSIDQTIDPLNRRDAAASDAGRIRALQSVVGTFAAGRTAAVGAAGLSLAVRHMIAARPLVAELPGTADDAVFSDVPGLLTHRRIAVAATVVRVYFGGRPTGPFDQALVRRNLGLADSLGADLIGAGVPVGGAIPARASAAVIPTLSTVAVVGGAFPEVAGFTAPTLAAGTTAAVVATFQESARGEDTRAVVTDVTTPTGAAAPTAAIRPAFVVLARCLTFDLALPAQAERCCLWALPAILTAAVRTTLLVVAGRDAFDAALVIDAVWSCLRAVAAAPTTSVGPALLAFAQGVAGERALSINAERGGLRAVTADTSTTVIAAFFIWAVGDATWVTRI